MLLVLLGWLGALYAAYLLGHLPGFLAGSIITTLGWYILGSLAGDDEARED